MQKIGKEVKIGLAVIGVLLVAFGYVLVKRLMHPGDPAIAAATEGSSPADSAAATNTSRTASEKPTVIAATDSDRPAEIAAAESKRSAWTIRSDRSPEASDAKRAEPAATSKNPFATTAREAAASPDAHTGSLFPRDENTSAGATRPDESRLHSPDGTHRDRQALGGAMQASDSAPIAAASADQGAGAEPRSIFAKSANDRAAADQRAADDKSLAGDKPAAADSFPRRSADAAPVVDPFPRHSADVAPPSNPFNRRTADASPPADPFPRRSMDVSATGSPGAERSVSDRPHEFPNALTPVENPGLKSPGMNDSAADSRNPLRHPGDADSQPAAATDSGNRFPSQSRFSQADSGAAAPAVPLRDGGAFDRNNRLEPGTAAELTPPRPFVANDAPQSPVADTASAKPGQYVVQPNDNYWTISERVYGTGGYFKAIFEQNRPKHPNAERLQVGEVLSVPDPAVLQKNYPDLCPKPGHAAAPQRTMPASARMRPGTRVYVVEEGDTLFEIARHQLGKPSRWGEIYQLNREALGSDFDYLKPGTELLIPGDGRPDPIARQPGGTLSQ
ncbi:MAG TPA: LysM peptidoglycan-binding domain-containing protein [Pirellulales bacterium]|jgi:nucleoid-associated protein YgaU|nr:LysM peptidoglycan-binding domain-containing protein [Pirellulales bacterium]